MALLSGASTPLLACLLACLLGCGATLLRVDINLADAVLCQLAGLFAGLPGFLFAFFLVGTIILWCFSYLAVKKERTFFSLSILSLTFTDLIPGRKVTSSQVYGRDGENS